jgi:phospholipase/carboxylesterase
VWYPFPFHRGAENEPSLTAAVDRVEREVKGLEQAGIPRERIMVGGFSQGACLAAKYAFTYPGRYGGFFILSGALPGLFEYVVNNMSGIEEFEEVDLQGTKVLVGCGDADPMISVKAADWTAWAFEKIGADVDKRIYEGLGHTVCQDTKDVLKSWVEEMVSRV